MLNSCTSSWVIVVDVVSQCRTSRTVDENDVVLMIDLTSYSAQT